MTDETQLEYKLRFAALLQRVPKSERLARAVDVARQVVGKADADRYPLAVIKMAQEWPYDQYVIDELDRLDSIPLSKEQWLQMVLDQMNQKYGNKKELEGYYRMYGEAQGWIAKNATGKESGDPGEWLRKTLDMKEAAGIK